jgi:MFS family permease
MKAYSGPKISKKGWLTIAFLFTVSIINVADKAIIGLASVPIMKELDLTPSQWGIVGSSFFWLFSLSALLVGFLSDYVGTKRVITAITSVWAVAQFATIFTMNLPYLVLTRIILGAGEGPTYGLSMTMAAKSVPKEKVGLSLTLVSIGNTVGAAIAAPVLLYFIVNHGWRSAFIFLGVVGAIWTILWVFMAKEIKEENNIKAGKKSKEKVKKASWSEVLPKLFSRNFILISLCAFASYWFFSIELAWFPNYFEKARGIDGTMLQLAIMIPWVLTTISQLLFSTVSDRIYAKTQNVVRSRVFIVGPLILLAALFYFLATVVESNVIAVTLLSLAVSLRSIIMVLGPAILTSVFPKQHYGKVQGSYTAIYYLAGILAPFVTGLIIQNAATTIAGFHQAFTLGAVLLFVSGLLFWIWVRPQDQSTDSQKPLDVNETISVEQKLV